VQVLIGEKAQNDQGTHSFLVNMAMMAMEKKTQLLDNLAIGNGIGS
jgi:hypothetical protein